MSWNYYLNQARRAVYGEKVSVPKEDVLGFPRGFEGCSLSLDLGAKTVYREEKATDTLQLREYEDRYTIQKDQYHPEEHPVAHAVVDATEYTALAAVGIGALLSGGA